MIYNSLEIVGSVGHASVVLDDVKQINQWSVFVILDESADDDMMLSVDGLYKDRNKY